MLTTGKRTSVNPSDREKKRNFENITNRKRDLHASFVNARGRFVRRVNWNAEEFSLNTESFVDLNGRKLSLLSDRWKNCDLLVKLVVMLGTRAATIN